MKHPFSILLALMVSVFALVLMTACSQSDSDSSIETAAVTDTSYGAALKATMKIVKDLNHHPSTADQSALTDYIAEMDGSVNGVALTEVMAVVRSMEHFPSDSDKAKLEKLVADLAANEGDADLIALAEIVGRVAHKVSAEDKAALDVMLAK